MAAAVGRCREIDPSECRAIAELYYSPERMVADYVDAFHGAIEHAHSTSPLARAHLPERFRTAGSGDNAPSSSRPPEKGVLMLALLLILLLLAIVFGGFFVFSLKVAVVVAIVLLLAGALGGYSFRGRRTV